MLLDPFKEFLGADRLNDSDAELSPGEHRLEIGGARNGKGCSNTGSQHRRSSHTVVKEDRAPGQNEVVKILVERDRLFVLQCGPRVRKKPSAVSSHDHVRWPD